MPVVTAEAHTHLDLCTAYSTVVRPSIAQKIAPYSSSPNEKWTKNPTSLHSKWHSKKSTTLCNGLPTTSNICHPTLRMPQPTIHNIRHHQQYSAPKQPSPSPDLLPIISLCHNQPSTLSPTPQITYPPAVPQIRYPMPNNTNPHVNTEANPPPPPPHKSKSLRNSLTPSPPTTQSSQLSEVPTLILIPRDSVETITYKSIM
jgi:hypothetical protein